MNQSKDRLPNISVVVPYPPSPTETFINSHIEFLPANVVTIHGWRPAIGDQTVLSWSSLVFHKLRRTLTGAGLEDETTAAYVKVFREHRTEAVLAEYGTTGVLTVEACREVGIPLIVYFFGFDASVRSVLEEHADSYRRMFGEACAIVAVSRSIQRKLISLGAAPEKIHIIPCGVDCKKFVGAAPAAAPPLFIAVGRFVEKKAPHLTIKAFEHVYKTQPTARLKMIGDGPLWDECRELSNSLGLAEAIEFPGPLPHGDLRKEMQQARCFVQHSVEAPSGDCEGTPVGILEAGASGLPVISTRHAGIPDVVVEGETGFLVDEGDVESMASHMLQIAQDPDLAASLGRAARMRIAEHFSIERSIDELWGVIESCIHERRTIHELHEPARSRAFS
jgi:glycosyltransferase involved in cell wall biosynthesis